MGRSSITPWISRTFRSSDSSATPSIHPIRSFPWNGTSTRAPGTARSSSPSGTS